MTLREGLAATVAWVTTAADEIALTASGRAGRVGVVLNARSRARVMLGDRVSLPLGPRTGRVV